MAAATPLDYMRKKARINSFIHSRIKDSGMLAGYGLLQHNYLLWALLAFLESLSLLLQSRSQLSYALVHMCLPISCLLDLSGLQGLLLSLFSLLLGFSLLLQTGRVAAFDQSEPVCHFMRKRPPFAGLGEHAFLSLGVLIPQRLEHHLPGREFAFLLGHPLAMLSMRLQWLEFELFRIQDLLH